MLKSKRRDMRLLRMSVLQLVGLDLILMRCHVLSFKKCWVCGQLRHSAWRSVGAENKLASSPVVPRDDVNAQRSYQ